VEGEVVAITVRDRGPGIPADEQAMVFERFYRGREHIDREGTGLGLAIVRRIVERWDGNVALSSSQAGTTVEMRFPQAKAAS
jgi:signal transduction histidine kinase